MKRLDLETLSNFHLLSQNIQQSQFSVGKLGNRKASDAKAARVQLRITVSPHRDLVYNRLSSNTYLG